MNLQQAKQIIDQLSVHKGNSMKPYSAPIKGFVIIPNDQQAYMQMYKSMADEKLSFNQAISPYSDDVTIVVCFDAANTSNNAYCSYTQFVATNNLDIQIPS
jgi:hypothetical protein